MKNLNILWLAIRWMVAIVIMPLHVTIFPLYRMIKWGTWRRSWGYKDALRFEMRVLRHNLCD